jgi:translation initiation factor RLI1
LIFLSKWLVDRFRWCLSLTTPCSSSLISIFAELTGVMERDVENLSGGELQRFAIGMSAVRRADV